MPLLVVWTSKDSDKGFNNIFGQGRDFSTIFDEGSMDRRGGWPSLTSHDINMPWICLVVLEINSCSTFFTLKSKTQLFYYKFWRRFCTNLPGDFWLVDSLAPPQGNYIATNTFRWVAGAHILFSLWWETSENGWQGMDNNHERWCKTSTALNM
jgi:hypothetical protein